jgi:GT2 family glycosyltransferase/SAM-dependent methyltransferase
VPWAPDAQVVYEHLHRYLWAAEMVASRRVLDLASGEGFGAAILASVAESVVGIEIDDRTVAHSRANYEDANLSFELGDATDLSRFEAGSFGAVVAFEMIEHVAEQERVLAEIERVLAPDGLLLMSTPDRIAYSETANYSNPFHVRELSQHEFEELLRGRFAHVSTWGQRTIAGSALSGLGGAEAAGPEQSFFVAREGDSWTVAAGLSPKYVVAVASNAPLPAVPSESTLGDTGLELLRGAEADRAGDLARFQEEVGAERAERLKVTQLLRDTHIDLMHKMGLLTAAQGEAHRLGHVEAELAATTAELRRLQGSVLWGLFQGVRRRFYGLLGGEGSFASRGIQAALRRMGRTLQRRRARGGATAADSGSGPGPVADGGIGFPEFEDPEVSLIIPVYRHPELTRVCLTSIAERTAGVSYEVIIIDDQADAASRALLGEVRGARVLVNDTNIGYLRSVNRAARSARGRWIVLCNNDIEVGTGWLSAMHECATSSPDIGIVTPKYLYPDRSLNEAGAIIWQDGTGWNYGRHEGPNDCYFEFRRNVDYGSAAALMVKADLWLEIGGYDERYVPMYYEDVDLCFAARERGQRVVYEPAAHVVHVEGASAGTDITTGPKRHQETNRARFVEKWQERLRSEHVLSDPAKLRVESDRGDGPRVLVIDHLVPLWDRDAGSLRMRGVVEALVAVGCRVTFLPDDLQARQPYTRELQEMGVSVLYGPLHVERELAAIAGELSLVISSRPHTTARWIDMVRGVAPTVPFAYDTVDLHWVRETRRAALGAGGADLSPRAQALRELELALVRASDITLVASDTEVATIQAEVPDAAVRVIPTYHEVRPEPPPVDGRSTLVYVGSFDHPPNIDAAVALVRDVMPLVWQVVPEVQVQIIGAAPPPAVEALASDRVEVTGWVKEIDPLLDAARALVAPLSYGAGMKGKVTQALAIGLPVVTTPIGVEGIPAHDGEEMLIGATPEELAERAIRILRDDDLWTRLSAAGLELAAKVCSPAVFAERMGDLLEWATALSAPSQPAFGSAGSDDPLRTPGATQAAGR